MNQICRKTPRHRTTPQRWAQIALMTCLAVTACERKQDAAASQLEHDYGYVATNSTHIATMRLHNPNRQTMVITDVSIECQCTKLEKPPGTIAAGETASFDVTFVAPDRPAVYTERIILQTDHDKEITLIFHARVGLPLKITPAVIDLGYVVAGYDYDTEVTVTNDGPDPVLLLYSTFDAHGCTAVIPRNAILAEMTTFIPVTVSASSPSGVRNVELTIHTDSKIQPTLTSVIKFSVQPAG